MMGKKVTVILPAYNEAEAIGQVIDEILEADYPVTILVGDNLSTDGTFEVARGKGVSVVKMNEKGKGGTVQALICLVDAPYLIMIDSDFTYPLGTYNLMRLLSCLNGDSDVVMGYRASREKGSMSLTNQIGNRLLSLLASVLYGRWVRDLCTGMWAFKKESLDKFEIVSEGFTLEADLFTNAVRHHCKIEQIPISYRKRPGSSQAKLKVSDGFKIGWFLIKRRFGYV